MPTRNGKELKSGDKVHHLAGNSFTQGTVGPIDGEWVTVFYGDRSVKLKADELVLSDDVAAAFPAK